MDFDLTQFQSVAPLSALTVAGCVLLLLEAFGSGRTRSYLMPLTLASIGVALALELMQWGDASLGYTTFHGLISLDRYGIVLVGAALAAMFAPAFMREHHFEFGEFYSLLLFATVGMMILAQATVLVT